jgi:hypothetical protein
MRLLGFFCAVLGAAATAGFDARGVQHAADDMISHAGQVTDAPAAHQHDRVFLQIMVDAGDVRRDFFAVGKADAGDLTQRGVGLLGGHGLDDQAHAALLRAGLKVLHLVDSLERHARLFNELVDRGHCKPFPQLVIARSAPAPRDEPDNVAKTGISCKGRGKLELTHVTDSGDFRGYGRNMV